MKRSPANTLAELLAATNEEKASRVTELKAALSRQAIEYPGVLPADAQATWDADTAELETLERDAGIDTSIDTWKRPPGSGG